MPNSLNGTSLSAEEYRDSFRLRFGMISIDLPSNCDGCNALLTVEHAMTYRKGGLILHRHNDIAAEWHQLCSYANTPSAITDEPLIPQHCRIATTEGRDQAIAA